MDLDVAAITAVGTAVATVILSIAPLVRAFKEHAPHPNGLDQWNPDFPDVPPNPIPHDDQGNLTISH